MAFDDPLQRLILSHAVLAGLTPLIPVPFVDDVVNDRVQRRLVRALATAHTQDLSAADVRILGDTARSGWVGRTARNVAIYPLKKIFQKTFFVLALKGMVDTASTTWHRGFLLDHAMSERWCAPTGPHSATEVRAAIDEVCNEVPVTPVEPALRAAFERSGPALRSLVAALRSALGRGPAGPPDSVTDAAIGRRDLDEVVIRMARELSAVPAEHLDRLRSSLARRLAPRVEKPAPAHPVNGAPHHAAPAG